MENDRFSETLLQHEETPLCTSVEAQTGKVTSMTCGSGCGFSDVGNRTKDTQVRTEATKKLIIAVVLCLIFITVEVIGGLIANSLAILTDAAHLLSDVASFAISLFAIWAASWEATPRQTYGFFRLEILGALLSIQLIWLLTGILVYEAIDRILHHSKEVDGRLMFLIACIGLFFNMIMVFLFGHYGHDHSHGNHGHSHHSQGNDHDNDNAHRDHNHIRSHHYERIYHNEGSMDDNGHSHGNRGHSHHSHGNDHANDNGRTDHSHGRSHHYERIYHSEGSIADVSLDIKHEHRKPDCTLHVNEAHVSLNDKRQEQHEVLIVEQDVEEGRHADHGNINVRGAYLHVFGDLIQSVGVMVGGAIIWVKPSWKVVDLICTLFFSLLVLSTTIKMMRDIVEILMESTPREIDATKLEKGLLAIPGVVAIHELHIWAITTGKTSLACHLRIDTEANPDIILKKAVEYCEKIFSISHVTVQIERN